MISSVLAWILAFQEMKFCIKTLMLLLKVIEVVFYMMELHARVT